MAFRPAARAMDRDDSNTSEDRFQVLLTYLAANAAELRQLQCQDMASLLRTGEARRGKPAISDRAALYRFLQRQGHAFTEGQREELRAWEARLCVSPKQAQPELQDQYERFLALLEKRADFFISLRKVSLKLYLKSTELRFGKNFMLRCYPQLSQEQMDELAEWEAMLCDVGEGERLAFRPALQRQLAKFIAVLENRAEYLQSLQKPSLKALFEAHAAKTDKELRFGKNFMLRCYPQLSQEQMDELAEWEAMLCDAGEGERLAFRPALQRQLAKFIAVLKNRAEYLQSLQKPSLKALFEAHAVKNDKELRFGKNFMLRCYPQLSQEQMDELAEWEAMLCEPGEGERLAFWPALQRQLEKFIALLEDRAEYFQSLQKPSLKSFFEVHAVKNDQGLKFGQNFMRRCYPKLSQGQKDELAEWEAMLCEPGEGERLAFRPALQRQVDRFVALLASRRAEFLQEKESSLGALFRAARRGRDKDWRFGHEFVSRVLPKLSAEIAAQVQQAAASCLCPAERAARKAPHEPKLHVEECALGDDLPRPRLPKCLRAIRRQLGRGDPRPNLLPPSARGGHVFAGARVYGLRVLQGRVVRDHPAATPCRARSRPLPSRRATLSLRQRRTGWSPAKQYAATACQRQGRAPQSARPLHCGEPCRPGGVSGRDRRAHLLRRRAAVADTAHRAHLHAARYWAVRTAWPCRQLVSEWPAVRAADPGPGRRHEDAFGSALPERPGPQAACAFPGVPPAT